MRALNDFHRRFSANKVKAEGMGAALRWSPSAVQVLPIAFGFPTKVRREERERSDCRLTATAEDGECFGQCKGRGFSGWQSSELLLLEKGDEFTSL